MNSQPAAASRLQRLRPLAGALVIFYAATLLLWDLHAGRALTLHEVFAAQPAREMVEGRHWIVPMFLGVPRTNKPPTMSWLIAASMTIFGSEREVAARLPAALSGVITAWLIAVLAGRWYGSRTGLLTGLFQATTVYTLMQARLAEADMPMCAAVTAAFVTFAFSVLPANRFRGDTAAVGGGSLGLRSMLFHTFLGMAFLLKGPVGPLFVILACLPYALIAWLRWKQREPVRLLAHPAGVAVLLAFVTIWPISAYLAYPPILQSWKTQILGRLGGELGGREPFLFYAYTLPWLTLPAFLFVPGAFVRFHKSDLFRPVPVFLALWLLGGFVLLQVSVFKHKHYLIPLLPPLSIAAAIGMTRWLAWRQRRLRRTCSRNLGWLALIGFLAAASVLGIHRSAPPDLHAALDAMAGLLWILLGASVWFEARSRIRSQLACFFGAIWSVQIIIVSVLIPRFDSYSVYADFAARTLERLDRVEKRTGVAPRLYLHGLGEAQIAFYLPLNTRRADKASDLLAELEERAGGGPIYIISSAKAISSLLAGTNAVALEQIDQAELRRKSKEENRLVLVKAWRDRAGKAAQRNPGQNEAGQGSAGLGLPRPQRPAVDRSVAGFTVCRSGFASLAERSCGKRSLSGMHRHAGRHWRGCIRA